MPFLSLRPPTRAFTLIELLIVVAIIAILAAIAVPNFLEAQVRSKVSRAQSDMRSIATVLEAYQVDHNRYPIGHGNAPFRIPGSQRFDGYGNARTLSMSTLPPNLTTPVAYLTAVMPDVFKIGRKVQNTSMASFGRPFQNGNPFDLTFVYHPVAFWADLTLRGFNSGFDAGDVADYGAWRIFSLGPDGLYNSLGTSDRSLGWIYDPTNGTISSGMILRTQADTVGKRFTRTTP
jgi:prepilin-type N-terminal cleavage/methylation domain-containing protein